MIFTGQEVFTCSEQIGIIGEQEDLFIEHNIVSWSRWCAEEVLFIKATCIACFQIWQPASLVLMSRTLALLSSSIGDETPFCSRHAAKSNLPAPELQCWQRQPLLSFDSFQAKDFGSFVNLPMQVVSEKL